MVGARDRRTWLHGRRLVLDRDEAEVPQDEQQIGCVRHRGAREHVLAQVDLGDDALAARGVAELTEIGDEPLA